MEKLFEKLPYDDLEVIKFSHLLSGSIVIGLVLFLAYYFTLYSATNREFEKLTRQKEVAEITLNQYKDTLAKEGFVAKNMARVRGRFNAFKNQMPRQNKMPNLIQKIMAFGKNRNIKVTALTMKEGAIHDFYKEIPFKIEVNGGFWATLDFIEYVQNLLSLVNFENLILQGQGTSTSGAASSETMVGSLNTTLTAKTYSFLDGSEHRSAQK
jgi:type IV pilus assembly protein PilO